MTDLVELITNTNIQDIEKEKILLTRGVFGDLYLVKIHDVPVCYKKRDKDITIEVEEEIEKEINLMKRLQHKNIIQCYGTKIVGKEMRIYMEYANMGTLTKWMKDNPVKKRSKEIIMNFFEQMVEGLNCIHSNFVIHRDLKPDHMLLKQTDEGIIIKICDFAVAKHFDKKITQKTFSEMRTGKFFGTPIFMAPEVLKQEPYNYKVDIWSMGCILCMMCFDKLPFEKMPDILFARIQPYQETEENKIFVEIIKQMIVKEPEKRINCQKILEVIKDKERKSEIEIEIEEINEEEVEIEEIEKKEEEIERKEERMGSGKIIEKGGCGDINRYSMIVISKYFNTIHDYINIEKCCKEYNGIMEQFKYNPIPFKSEKERELFKNIETYHFYGEEIEEISEEEMRIITNDERIKKYIYWGKVSYSFWKENKKEEEEYKNIEYGKEDMEKYLFDHGEWSEKYLKTEKVEIEEGITNIGNICFENCVNLKEIKIPSCVSFIGEGCFRGCRKLEGNIQIDPNNPTFRTDGTRIYRKDNNERVFVWCNDYY